MFSGPQLTGLLCAGLHEPLARLAASSPMAAAFAHHASGIPAQALLRHAAEHVFRIRMFRPLDAAATELLARDRGDVGQEWARYARSESVHDRYFLRDLNSAGINRDAVDGLGPFRSTLGLGNFVAHAMQPYGALPVVLYSFWAEQNSETGTAAIIVRNQAEFGERATKGATAHRALDAGQAHPDLISQVLSALIKDVDDVILAIGLLERITALLGEYFAELGAWSQLAEADALIERSIQHRARRRSAAVGAALV